MKKAVIGGVAYWAFVFGLGFILGAVRTLWLAPLLGNQALAVLVELPFMLAASWFAATFLVRRLGLRARVHRALMGMLAFALLMTAEAFLGIVLMGDTPRMWLASLGSPAGLLGLAGQLLFAIMPLIVKNAAR
jgi:hypothetical protein